MSKSELENKKQQDSQRVIRSDHNGLLNFRKGKYILQKGAAPNNANPYDDPTFLSFTITFLIGEPGHKYHISGAPEIDIGGSPLMNGAASKYLREFCKDNNRAQALKAAVTGLNKVNVTMPWVWQSISGLENAPKLNKMLEPFQGGEGDENKLTIECLETYDLMMTGIIDMYRYAVYDTKRWVEVVPKNMRQFSMVITVGDARQVQNKIRTTSNQVSTDGPAQYDEKFKSINTKVSYEYIPRVSFYLHGCEIDVDESMTDILSTLNNSSPEQAKSKLTIRYEKVEDIEIRTLQGLMGGNFHRYKGRYIENQLIDGVDPTYVTKDGEEFTQPTNPVDSGNRSADSDLSEGLSYGRPVKEAAGGVPDMGQDMMPNDPNLINQLADKIKSDVDAIDLGNSLDQRGGTILERLQEEAIGAALLGNVHGGFELGNVQDAISAGGVNGILNLVGDVGEAVGGSTLPIDSNLFSAAAAEARIKMLTRELKDGINIFDGSRPSDSGNDSTKLGNVN